MTNNMYNGWPYDFFILSHRWKEKVHKQYKESNTTVSVYMVRNITEKMHAKDWAAQDNLETIDRNKSELEAKWYNRVQWITFEIWKD